MKVGIDARVLGTQRALDVYLRNILVSYPKTRPEDQITLLVSNESQKTLVPKDRFQFRLVPASHTFIEHFNFKKNIVDFDVFWHPDNREFINCISNSVVTIHDLLPIKFPEIVLSKDPFLNFRQKVYLRMLKSAWKKAKTIITVSQSSASDIEEIIGVSKNKINVVYNGVSRDFFKIRTDEEKKKAQAKYRIESPYIFYIGGLNAHKNVATLIRAMSLVKHKNIRLVIGGKTDSDNSSGQNIYQEILSQAKKLGVSDRLVFSGFIQDEDLPAIYQGAKVFVYPSFYEGFGLPPLEALASGVPVICSNSASLPEVVGEAGILIDPNDYEGFAKGVDRILEDSKLANSLINKGLLRASEFSWEKAAGDVYNILIESYAKNQAKN